MMNTRTTTLQRLKKFLHIKASPLNQGCNGPYIFIHINKTAGTSIGSAIGIPVKDHLTAKEVIQKIGKQDWNSAYKFTLVRNPWDKAVSLYEYRRKKNKTQIRSKDISFEKWITMTHSRNQDPSLYDNPKSFQPQIDWLKDDEGKMTVDFVGRFESLQGDFSRITKAIGISAELPHLNASSRNNYQDYYSNNTRKIIATWYQEDIDYFGYTFNGQ